MAIYPKDLQTNKELFHAEIVHGVRSILAAWDVYHAPWIIIATQPDTHTVRLEAFWDTKNTPPRKITMSLDSTWFDQKSNMPIKSLCDINLVGLARALRRRMSRMTHKEQ